MSVPAAAPMVKPPPGVGTWIRPMAMPTARPSARPPTLMSDMPRSLSPRYLPTSAIWARGAMTRSRSPIASTKVSWATRSTSPRRTRLTVAPNFSSRSSSPTVWPTSGLFDRVTRRKSRSWRSSTMSCDDTWPSRSATSSRTARGPTTVTRSLWPIVSVPAGTIVGFAAWACLRRETPISSSWASASIATVIGSCDLDAHGDVADLLAPGLRARAAQRPGRDDEHDDDATEVGDRVADRRRRGVRCAGGCRRERGGVGQRTGVGAGHGAGLEAERPPDQDRDHADQREGGGDDEHRGPPAAQRGEEVGAGDDTDRVREQDQPEGADHLGDLEVDPRGGGPGGDAQGGEEHGGRAEADPGDPHVADGRTEAQQDREEEERVLGKGLEQGGHVIDPSTV